MKKFLLLCLICLYLGGNEFKIKVGVSLAPYAYFLEKVGGEFVDVMILIPQARNPKKYDLKPKQIKQIRDLKLLIAAGAEYEKRWLPRFEALNPSLRILNFSSQACKDAFCYSWLSFAQARQIAKEIAHQLRILDLKNAQNYKENLDLFLQELEEMEKELKSKSFKNVIDYRPVWQILSAELGLDYLLLKDVKEKRKVDCFITPFDDQKAIYTQYGIPSSHLLEINPFKKDWKQSIMEFAKLLERSQVSELENKK